MSYQKRQMENCSIRQKLLYLSEGLWPYSQWKTLIYQNLEHVYMHEEPELWNSDPRKTYRQLSNGGKSMTARQPHQIMDYVLLEMLDRSPLDLSCQELLSWLVSTGQERRTSSLSLLNIFSFPQFFKRGTKPPWIWANYVAADEACEICIEWSWGQWLMIFDLNKF